MALSADPVRQDPAAVLGRAVAVGHVLGAAAGLRETDRLREVLGDRHRWHAVRGHLHELGGDPGAAAAAYAEAARRATDVAERDHLVRQAARVRHSVRGAESDVLQVPGDGIMHDVGLEAATSSARSAPRIAGVPAATNTGLEAEPLPRPPR